MEVLAYKRFYGRRSYVLKHIARSVMRAAKQRQFSLDFVTKYSKWFMKTITKVNELGNT
jgi:hypothetical protein